MNRPQQPNAYVTIEEDSQSSEGDQQNSPAAQDSNDATQSTSSSSFSPAAVNENNNNNNNNNNNTILTTIVTQSQLPPAYRAPIEPVETFQVHPDTSNKFLQLCESVITPASNYTLNKSTNRITSLPAVSSIHSASRDAPGKDKNRKKNKQKPISKTRTIKFHEYKGPPNAQKNGLLSLSTEETSYQLLLKQQNCLLEYLEGLHKNATSQASNSKPAPPDTQSFSVMNNFMQQSSPASNSSMGKPSSPVSSIGDTSTLELSKLEKMKVSDLKMLLKTRNLPVSGPKPQLIERLKPFVQQDFSSDTMINDNGIMDDDNDDASRISPIQMETDTVDMHEVAKQRSNVDLLREQQRKIDELQRKLKESQQELHQMQMKQNQPATVILTQTDVTPNKPELMNQKQIFKQQLEAKIQKDKLQKLENLQKMQMEQQQQQLEMQRRKQGKIFEKLLSIRNTCRFY